MVHHRVAALMSVLAACWVSTAAADPVVNVLVTPSSYSGCADPAFDWIDLAACTDLTSSPQPGPGYVWLVAGETGGFPDGIGAIQFGVEHSLSVSGWTLCTGGNEIPTATWPASGAGNAATWTDGCYNSPGENARIGFFAVAEADDGAIVLRDHPEAGPIQIIDCSVQPHEVCSTTALDLSVGGGAICEPIAPDTPTNCRLEPSCVSQTVRWDHAGTAVTWFDVFRNDTFQSRVPGYERAYIDTGAPESQSRYYHVVAVGCDDSARSNVAIGTWGRPLSPTMSTTGQIGCEARVRVNWNDRSGNETSFDVIRNDVVIGSVDADIETYVDETAELGQEYVYWVNAVNPCGEVQSTSSRLVQVADPLPATNCAASDDRGCEVEITWESTGIGVQSFTIRRDGEWVVSRNAASRSYIHTTATPDEPGLYTVTTNYYCGSSFLSNSDEGTALGASLIPENVRATRDDCDAVTLTWEYPDDLAGSFRIVRDGATLGFASSWERTYVDGSATGIHLYEVTALTCTESDPVIVRGSICGFDVNAHVNMNVVLAPASYSGCEDPIYDWIEQQTCIDLVSTPIAGPSVAWVVASEPMGFPAGIAALQFGVEYDASVTGWTSCTGGLEIPQAGWPASGTGNAVAWDECMALTPGNVRVGYFLLGTGDAGTLQVTGDPRLGGQATYTTCFTEQVGICGANLSGLNLASPEPPACLEVPGDPPSPAAGCVADDGVCATTVEWTHDGQDVLAFDIRRDDEVVGTVAGGERSYVDETATPAIPHVYDVIARNYCGAAAPSNPATGTLTSDVGPATNVSASDDLCDAVQVTWEHPGGTTGFRVLRDGTEVAELTGGQRQFFDLEGPLETESEYVVIAIGCAEAPASDPATGRLNGVPVSPNQVVASFSCPGAEVPITWSDRSDAETGFRVLRGPTGGVLQEIGQTGPDTESFMDTDPWPDVVVDYALQAMNECGNSLTSNRSTTRFTVGAPLEPQDLSASAECVEYVDLTWTDAAFTETEYVITRDGEELAVVSANTESYRDEAVALAEHYTYQVTARSACGQASSGPFIGNTTGLVPESAQLLTPRDECGFVQINWNDRSENENGFRIYRNDALLATVEPNVEQYVDATVEAGESYTYYVVAFSDCAGDAEPSAARSVVASGDGNLAAPLLVFPDDAAICQASAPALLTWDPVPGAHGYHVRYSLNGSCDDSTVIDVISTSVELELPEDTLISWSVAAYGACGFDAASSACRTFTTDIRPDAPTDLIGMEQSYLIYRFVWDAVPEAIGYILRVSSEECYRIDEWPYMEVFVPNNEAELDLYEFDDYWFAWVVAVELGNCDTWSQSVPSNCELPGGGGLPVQLDSYRAEPVADGVLLEWRTLDEHDIDGFHVWRSVGTSYAVRLTDTAIDAEGAGSYRFVDETATPGQTYDYRLTELTTGGNEVTLATVRITTPPAVTMAMWSAPNPFNPKTTLTFVLPDPAGVRLHIYDAAGRRVRELLGSETFAAGTHQVVWDGRDDGGRALASGAYFARLRAGDRERHIRLVLLK